MRFAVALLSGISVLLVEHSVFGQDARLNPAHEVLRKVKNPGLLNADLLDRETALICEAGNMLGGGGQADVGGGGNLVGKPSERQVLIEFVSKIDMNGDLQLTHDELQALDFLTRRQLLDKLDLDFDRKLSASEIDGALARAADSKQSYPRSQQPEANVSNRPEAFRNMRRFGIGLQQPAQSQRRQPFAQAAQFGTTSNFRPPRKKTSARPTQFGAGHCQLSISGQSDLYLRVPRAR